MFKSGVAGQTQKNLAALAQVPFVKHYYLAGGTAVALHLGHRLSFDLDFFSDKPADPETIIKGLHGLGEVDVAQNDPGTFNGMLNQGKVSFFVYPFGLLEDTFDFDGIKIAQLMDLTCMKLEVVSSRGSKRDFIDLYYLIKKIGLEKAFIWFLKKFKRTDVSLVHVVRSLTYFDDAEEEVMPKMLTSLTWNEVKDYFKGIVREYIESKGLLGFTK